MVSRCLVLHQYAWAKLFFAEVERVRVSVAFCHRDLLDRCAIVQTYALKSGDVAELRLYEYGRSSKWWELFLIARIPLCLGHDANGCAAV